MKKTLIGALLLVSLMTVTMAAAFAYQHNSAAMAGQPEAAAAAAANPDSSQYDQEKDCCKSKDPHHAEKN